VNGKSRVGIQGAGIWNDERDKYQYKKSPREEKLIKAPLDLKENDKQDSHNRSSDLQGKLTTSDMLYKL
jgi:hypothetical protein